MVYISVFNKIIFLCRGQGMKYFIDSSYIIALINQNDSLHQRSLEYLNLIEENECYISNLIINEVVTVIGNKIDLETAVTAFDLLYDIFIVLDEYDDKDLNYNTMLIYEKYNAKLSFTDSSIIVNMHNEGIDNLISFDKEFKRVEGINLLS